LTVDEFKAKYEAGCLASVAQLSGISPSKISVSITGSSQPASPAQVAPAAPATARLRGAAPSSATPHKAAGAAEDPADLDAAAPVVPLFAADGLPMFPNRLRKSAAKASAKSLRAAASANPATSKDAQVTASYGLHIGSFTQTIAVVSNLTGSSTGAVEAALTANGVPLKPRKTLVNGHRLKPARDNNEKLTYIAPHDPILDHETARLDVSDSIEALLPLENDSADLDRGQKQQPEEDVISNEGGLLVNQQVHKLEDKKSKMAAVQQVDASAEDQKPFLRHWGFKLLIVLGSFIVGCLLLTVMFCLMATYLRKKRRVESLDSEVYSEYDGGKAQDYHQAAVRTHQSFEESSIGDASDRSMLEHHHQDGK